MLPPERWRSEARLYSPAALSFSNGSRPLSSLLRLPSQNGAPRARHDARTRISQDYSMVPGQGNHDFCLT